MASSIARTSCRSGPGSVSEIDYSRRMDSTSRTGEGRSKSIMGTKKLGTMEPNVRTHSDDNAEVMIFSTVTLHFIPMLISAA